MEFCIIYKKTEQSDNHKYSIYNLQFSIPMAERSDTTNLQSSICNLQSAILNNKLCALGDLEKIKSFEGI
jgi:hypothetical protein